MQRNLCEGRNHRTQQKLHSSPSCGPLEGGPEVSQRSPCCDATTQTGAELSDGAASGFKCVVFCVLCSLYAESLKCCLPTDFRIYTFWYKLSRTEVTLQRKPCAYLCGILTKILAV